MRKYIFIIASIITFCINAQEPTTPNSVLSPNAASLGLYGEIPVSPFTGIPLIEIPIHETTIGNHKLSVSLSYHANGIRPDQRPGWTGLGWTLNAGGCISRIVNGNADDIYKPTELPDGRGFYYTHYRLDYDIWNTGYNVYKLALSDSLNFDNAPDKFIFNFMGYSGSFYMNEKGKWVVQCDKKLRVEFDSSFRTDTLKYAAAFKRVSIARSFNMFTITTEDGTKYKFGGTGSSIEYSIDFFQQETQKNFWTATSWFLTSVEYPDSRKAYFTYERGEYINQLYQSMAEDNYTILLKKDGKFESYSYDTHFNRDPELNFGQLISPVYLTKIEVPEGSICFQRILSNELNYKSSDYQKQYIKWKEPNWTTTKTPVFLPFLSAKTVPGEELETYDESISRMKWYALSGILIENSSNKTIKSFKLSYNNRSDQRLMLLSVEETNNGLSGEKYIFEYDNPELLPPYLAKQNDHWGFYNGREYDITDEGHYKCREPNENVLRYGVLKKIIYPTGGYTKFEFEPHRYRKYVDTSKKHCIDTLTNQIAGGLRINKIINSPSGTVLDEYVAKEYLYIKGYSETKNINGPSSGILSGLPKYYFKNYTLTDINDPNLKIIIYAFNSQSVLPLESNSSGSHIGYSETIEKYPDGSFSCYKYSNFDTGAFDGQPDFMWQYTPYPNGPFCSKEQERGLLVSKEDYTLDFKLIKRHTVDYEKDEDPGVNFVKALSLKKIQIPLSDDGIYEIQQFNGTAYRIYTYSMRKKKETVSEYDTGNSKPKTTTIEYKYNNDKLVSEIKRSANNNDAYITTFKYPLDYSGDIYTRMKIAHRLNNIIEKSETFLKAGDISAAPLSAIKFRYDKNILSPDQCYISVKGSDFRLKATYEYDFKNNLVYSTEDGNTNTVYLWGYNHQYVVARINNATLQEVKGIIGNNYDFASKSVPDFKKLDKLRQLLTEAHVYTYAYKPLVGLIYKTDPNGNTTYYEYDALGRLLCVKDLYGNILEAYKYDYSSK